MDNQKDFLERVDTHMKKSGEIIKILAVAGPNGGGKTTLIFGLMKKYPTLFCKVIQVTTRPKRDNDDSRRNVTKEQFLKEKIILGGEAGIYQYGYTVGDLMESIQKNKIIIFEGITRLRKLQNILGTRSLHYMIVGVLPPGKTIPSIIRKLKIRLLLRPIVSIEDVEKKLRDAESRLIPEIMRESHIIIRSYGNHTDADVEKVMKKWREMIK